MSEGSKKKYNTREILGDFEAMFRENSIVMNKLTEAVTVLTVVVAETKKDNEFDRATTARLETNQIDLGSKVSNLSKDMIAVKIHQKNSKSKNEKYLDILHKVVTGVLIIGFVMWTGMR